MLRDVRHLSARLWHWSARWPVFGVICALAIGMITLGEHAIGQALIFVSALSLISKLWHADTIRFLKVLGTVLIVSFLFVFGVIARDIQGESPWSHLPDAWARVRSGKWASSHEPFAISDQSAAFINMNQSLDDTHGGLLWFTYTSGYGATASPVAVAQYLEITNLSSMPETIKSFTFSMKTEDCGWIYLSPMDARLGRIWAVSTLGLAHAGRLDFQTNGLDYILQKTHSAVCNC